MPSYGLTDVQIFNKALERLGEYLYSVTAVDGSDTSKYGTVAGIEYQSTRNEELRSNNWIFAISRAVLALSGAANNTGFLYVYTVPASSLRVISVYTILSSSQIASTYQTQHTHEVPFVQEGAVIYCDLQNAYCRFVAEQALGTTWYEPLFTDCLAVRLAYKIAQSVLGLEGSKDEKTNLENEYTQLVQRAFTMNLVEQMRTLRLSDRKEDASTFEDLQDRKQQTNANTRGV